MVQQARPSSSSVTTPTLSSSTTPSDAVERTAWCRRHKEFARRQRLRREKRLQRRACLYRGTTALQQVPTGGRKPKRGFSNETGLAFVLLLVLISFGGLGITILLDRAGLGRGDVLRMLGLGLFA